MTAFTATVANGLEDLLVKELGQLGVIDAKPGKSSVHFTGDLVLALRVCLWSRIANRVLLPIATHPVSDDTSLYQAAAGIAWQDHLTNERTFAVAAAVSRSTITHSKYAALKVKDAIADGFRERTGERPSVQTERPDVQVNVFIDRNQAQFAVDLSGTSLHHRGYRGLGGIATLKENLAASVLMRAGWPELASRGQAFVDFMCGSGTLPIEAAMMAADIAPGLTRDYFGFLGWRGFDATIWEGLQAEAAARREAGLKRCPTVLGFDNHRPSLVKAVEHIRRAGLEDYVTASYQDVSDFRLDMPPSGLVAINPPYGRRVGNLESLESLYADIGRLLRSRFQGWRAAVLTDEKEKGKWLGVRADKIHSMMNGNIPCKLLHFEIAPENEIKNYRLPRLVDADARSDAAQGFANRLKKNRRKLQGWCKSEAVSCYRVYDADLPDYSAAVDVYHCEDDAVRVLVQEYAAPATVDPEKAKLRLSELLGVVRDEFDVPADQLFLKYRQRQRGPEQYEKVGDSQQFFRVREGLGCFLVNFEDYLDTGLFLDHRPLRLRIAGEAKGRSVLNLYAYTASISVHAGLGGARRTVSVDLSNTYLAWAKRNLELNGLAAADHLLERADCESWLEAAARKPERFDIVVLDPPSFSNSKRMDDTLDVQRDHRKLIDAAMGLVAENGWLYFSNNRRRFSLDPELFEGYRVTDISSATIPTDFVRRKNIHHCWKIEHLG